MDLKTNINKLHSDLLHLKGIGETITIKESSSKEFGNHFEITAEFNGMLALIILEKTEVESQNFKWMYYSNPEDKSIGLVERRSSLNDFTKDLLDIFDKKRFDSDYLSQIGK